MQIILLIYEYAIAVQWSVVKRKTRGNRNEPYAERLDRSYFDFDQDYYEQMPLLLNSLQENNYVDPTLDIIPTSRSNNRRNFKTSTIKPSFKYNSVRRTSPRPFFFEYRSPSPLPFSKTYGSKSWVERYRNEERLQNIRKVIKYLEKTINAKMGDMYTQTKPPSSSIAFTGLYVEPMIDKGKQIHKKAEIDLILEGSDRAHAFIKTHHQPDPLFNYKPNNPGEVNLLADAFLRFSPIPTPSIYDDITTNVPIYRTKHDRKCFGRQCKENINNIADMLNIPATTHTDMPLKNTKSFSVMLNLYPLKTTTSIVRSTEPTKSVKTNVNNVYFTTRKPNIQFRRKSIFPVRRYVFKERSRQLIQNKTKFDKNDDKHHEISTTNMLVHVNVYTPDLKLSPNNTKMTKEKENFTTTEPIMTTKKHYYTTEANVNPDEVEDYHMGSSGILPITTELPFIPTVTTFMPLLETATSSRENTWNTNIPDVVKFNAEDAKIPDQYIELKKLSSLTTEVSNIAEGNHNFQVKDQEISTLIVKLKNIDTNEEGTEVSTIVEEESSTTQTYVPQLNGHHRNTNQNLENLNSALDKENDRKRLSETSFTRFRKPYVEIRRNSDRKTTINYDD